MDAGPSGPPPADASTLCPGSTFVGAITDRPNLYFVLDRSGSMLDTVGGQEKFTALRTAVVSLVRSLGARANVGAALFPNPAEDGCSPGAEVFATREGQPAVSASVDSEATHAFAVATNRPPSIFGGGGTSTAATLTALLPTLTALPGRTIVLLATDGGPNCDANITCSADQCIPNIEQAPACASLNCCEPPDPNNPNDPRGGPLSCLDTAATLAAIEANRAAGILTYVIGLPSSASVTGDDRYASVLDQMAVAGGTARNSEPSDGGSEAGTEHQYYAVQQIDELDAVLDTIAGKVAITCTITLTGQPPDRSLVNVYLDGSLLPYDPLDGWVFRADGSIELRGAACDALEGGRVANVQVAAGCPTFVK